MLCRVHLSPPTRNGGDMLPAFLKTKVIVETISVIAASDPAPLDIISLRSAAMRGLLGKVEDDDFGMVRASLLAVWMLPRLSNGGFTVMDYDAHQKSLEYIKRNHEKVWENRRVIRERGTIDPEVISMVISSETSAINSGLL